MLNMGFKEDLDTPPETPEEKQTLYFLLHAKRSSKNY